ncbi:MAG: hypothetical protein AAGM40_28460 [Cyanobacteria bacterium J06573_2]
MNIKQNIEFLRQTIKLAKSPEEIIRIELAIHKLHSEISRILTEYYSKLSKNKAV